ncbi:hypothetical protein SNOG_09187 [Parastagonospora nodorum SN15]|uniref:Uncharacterized protein n=1 Tax=Phaeosphaeria nodorum (strain SN15 / ATCC MYA-4574 / FGSC 10173) TaxID=321614 RepID=Q0UGC7_PHANO|nr:hypothetical protein SNOG_09187 [Parastagonospora nodorum SN15]EAT83379.1 hypothetical protein SNOG_09187 [Parastagonospora nodorum SN15]
MSYALAASHSFILLITLTPSKALDITVLSTHLKSASSFSSRHAVPCVGITKPAGISGLRQLEILVDQALVLVGLVAAWGGVENRANLDPLPSSRTLSANDDCKRAHQTDSEGGCVTTEQPAAKYGARQSPTYNHALSSPM